MEAARQPLQLLSPPLPSRNSSSIVWDGLSCSHPQHPLRVHCPSGVTPVSPAKSPEKKGLRLPAALHPTSTASSSSAAAAVSSSDPARHPQAPMQEGGDVRFRAGRRAVHAPGMGPASAAWISNTCGSPRSPRSPAVMGRRGLRLSSFPEASCSDWIGDMMAAASTSFARLMATPRLRIMESPARSPLEELKDSFESAKSALLQHLPSFKDKPREVNCEHKFEADSLLLPSSCLYCDGLLWFLGNTHSVLRCVECGVVAHPACVPESLRPAAMPVDSETRMILSKDPSDSPLSNRQAAHETPATSPEVFSFRKGAALILSFSSLILKRRDLESTPVNPLRVIFLANYHVRLYERHVLGETPIRDRELAERLARGVVYARASYGLKVARGHFSTILRAVS
eukprot:RCo005170